MIQDVGCLVNYLPPYSPEFNLIKSAFSIVKLELQQSELAILQTLSIAVTSIHIDNTRKLEKADI